MTLSGSEMGRCSAPARAAAARGPQRQVQVDRLPDEVRRGRDERGESLVQGCVAVVLSDEVVAPV